MNAPETNDTAARLRRSVTRLSRRLRQSSLGGISPAQASMLATIEMLHQPSLGELAASEQVQPPSVTRIMKSLSGDGYITLTVDASDRRCTRASLTAKGRAELSVIRQRKTEFLEAKLRALPASEQARAASLVDLLEHLLEQS